MLKKEEKTLLDMRNYHVLLKAITVKQIHQP